MLLEKLARAIACKHCETPSKLYELQIHADEQAREILRLNHVLDESKKERDAARQAENNAILRLYEEAGALEALSEKHCGTCGNDYCMVRPEGKERRYNCHLWVQKEEEHEDHA